tara:strand:+ start:39 stop:752 length:714 start_codon:yes stop_codon:yes gene_type:complete
MNIISNYIKKKSKTKGIVAFACSFIIHFYKQNLSTAFNQAYNLQGFDIIYGTDTTAVLSSSLKWKENIISKDAEYADHSISDKVERITTALNYYKKNFNDLSDTSLIDFGCGKGRVLIIADSFGIKSLFGIELSPFIMEQCRKNLNKLGISCQFLNKSYNDVNYESLNFCTNIIIYAYNPSDIKILSESLIKLISAQKGKNFFFFYSNPQKSIDHIMGKKFHLLRKFRKLDLYQIID